MSELINAFCVFLHAGGLTRGSYYYIVIGAYQDENKQITHIAYKIKFDPTNGKLKFQNLSLDYESATRTETSYKFTKNPLKGDLQKLVNRSIVSWLRKPSELEHCKDKLTGENKKNLHYTALGMGKFFIKQHGSPMDRFEWEAFCEDFGSDNVRCILHNKKLT